MSSAICQNFVQNAWKKELCSNCFKSKDEHAERPKPKPIAIVPNENLESIIKNSNKFRPKRSVCFTKKLTEIIGFGGEDWESDVEDSRDDESLSSEEDFIAESEEEEAEKELKRITKENTDFNTIHLKEETIVKKTSAQLLLGKPLVDASGRKQTLMVSVTPFGEDTPPGPKRFIKSISHIPISKNNKESITETKSNVVLTSYTKNEDEKINNKEEKSLLDEITETLENSKNPIQIMSRKKIQKDIVLSVTKNDPNKENVNQKKKDEDTIDNKSKFHLPERKIGLSRTPALKRDQEKPVIYQTSTAKIELLNTKNVKLSKNNLNNNQAKSEIINRDKTDIPNNVETLQKGEDESISNNHEADNKIEEIVPEPEKVLGLPPIIPKTQTVFSQSREQAGEPDGRADPDVTEPPALPLTPPPPLESQNSFLHSNSSIYEKPKIPSKPATVLIRKPVVANHVETKNQVLTTFGNNDSLEEQKTLLSKQDSNGSDVGSRTANKRRAPKPPEDNQVYTRNSPSIKTDSPVVREKEKRERASSCSPKFRDSISDSPQCEISTLPEPAPRKSLSLSIDSLATCEEKRKEKSKGRFSLKKFLRMGTSKDPQKIPAEAFRNEDGSDPPLPKPRLVIVHPSELNGAKVEVVAKTTRDQIDYQNVNVSRYSDYNVPNANDYESFAPKCQRPPPPPRNTDNSNHLSKPALPHPPKSVEIINKQKQYHRNTSNGKKTETVYANIGEVRSAIVPNKPQRTASMREREAQQQKQERKNSSNNYEAINFDDNGENVYDYINSGRSSSSDSDSSPNKNSPTSKTARLNKRSESSIDVSGEYFKFSNIPRSLSLTYCGSETESEIYSPYSFYGSESEVTEDDHDWIQNGRTHKLRSRKGRSIVHKNLEDNYGAVIVANHEALAQVLENIQQTNHIQPALRGLKSLPNLRWTDFSLKSTSQPLAVGCRTFHQALWNTQHVTLVINTGAVPSSTLSFGNCSLTPVTEFSDLIPAKFLDINSEEDDKYIQATVAVLPWLQVSTIQSYSESLKLKGAPAHEDTWKDACFIMLQLVNALKILQAQGIEELSLSLNSFVLCREIDKDNYHRLCVLQGLGEETHLKNNSEKYGTLCMCASKALNLLQPKAKIAPLIQSLLNNERAVTLTQVKSILEFCLWGPSDVALGSTIRERELALQRWLDLQRATVLHGLVCARVQLTVYEECHLFFLVRSNSRMMCDASLLLESSNMKHALSNGHK